MEKMDERGLERILKIARKIFEGGAVCDRCIGRQFSTLCSGMGNLARGRSIRNFLLLCREEDKDAFNEMHLDYDEVCWVCGGFFDEIDEWVERCVERSQLYEYDTFLVGTHLSGLLSETEEYLWERVGASYAESIKADINRGVGKKLSGLTGKEVDFSRPDITFILDIPSDEVKLGIRPVFVYGRYKKYERGIPQTRCGYTGNIYNESVEEIIAKPMLHAFKGKGEKFHGAGREDIDARMMGNGRPFIMEIIDPQRRRVDLKKIEEEIEINRGKTVEVDELRFTDKREVGSLKSLRADKTYKCEVEFEEEVKEEEIRDALKHIKEGKINQRTPTRVLHRRADLVREREIYDVELVAYKKKRAALRFDCECGTYIKELITGDFGRTRPNLSDLLGVKSSVKELDVIRFGRV